MTTLDQLRSLDHHVLLVVLLVVIVVGMVVADAVLGRRDHRSLLAGVAQADTAEQAEGVRLSLYRRWTRSGWLQSAAILGVVLIAGVSPASLGLRLPDLSGYLTVEDSSSIAGLVTGAVVGLALVGVGLAIISRRSSAPVLPGQRAVSPMLPSTSRGRRGWAGLSVMAGVTEEVTYRAVVILAVVAVAPSASRLQVLVAAAVIFGAAHWYQGVWGVLGTGAMGFTFGALYLATGSVIPGMIIHVLVDLRALMIKAPAHRSTTADAAPASTTTPAGANAA
ncbi:hypothetical protein C8046_11280 [Serinibacter arcticus]|uniref:CAAX prenyl protease 2/Lysostaphin resistance protein A-like domain-containing protein n=1 Tax=Serinibacter arcticus TaxID=1655435 RepID=A0A2U1ZW25_9MICO|nr:type II CAAX endopeptidase family protein [Serinibacter arcticus]PWD51140.1 hypothetical protein C8046_11280 [Serinibacter arcticus]